MLPPSWGPPVLLHSHPLQGPSLCGLQTASVDLGGSSMSPEAACVEGRRTQDSCLSLQGVITEGPAEY